MDTRTWLSALLVVLCLGVAAPSAHAKAKPADISKRDTVNLPERPKRCVMMSITDLTITEDKIQEGDTVYLRRCSTSGPRRRGLVL